MTEPTKLDRPPSVRWGIFVVDGDRLRRPVLVGPDDELVLLAVVTPKPAWITVELYRGELLRDRREWSPARADPQAMLAIGLGRGKARAGSTRLRCRLLVNGRSIGERTVLLGLPAIDAQGRLAAAPLAAASEATRLAHVQLLEEAWRPPGEA